MRRAAKRDVNEPEIIAALKAIGATVKQLNDTNAPDLAVGFRGVNYFIEVKYKYGKLSDGQRDWHEGWNGQSATVWNVEQALQVIGAIE
jgi:hypothetical protein